MIPRYGKPFGQGSDLLLQTEVSVSRTALLTVIVALVLSLTACQAAPAAGTTSTPTTAPATASDDTAAPTETATDSNIPAEVSFTVFGDPPEFAAYEKLVAAFSATHPDIRVNLSNAPSEDEFRQRLTAGFANGSPPDIFLLDYKEFAAFAENGLEAVGPYLDKSSLIQKEDYYTAPIAAFTYQGQLWCMPQNMSSLVVYYNKDLFDAAGIDYPTNDWTWDEFVSTAQALTQDIDNDGITDQYGVGVATNFFRLTPFIWSNGGEIVDNIEAPTRLTVDTPEAMEAFQAFVDLQVEHKVAPDAVAEESESSQSRFLNGRLGMFLNSRRSTTTFRTIEDFAWDTVHIPYFKETVTVLHSDAFCMAKATQNKDAAWAFIEYANSVEGQTILAETGRTVPSLRAVAESPAFLSPDLPPANSKATFLDLADAIRPTPNMPTWVNIEEIAGQEVERAFYGNATVEEAIQQMNELAAPLFSQE